MATLWLWETQGIYNELLQTSQTLGADLISSDMARNTHQMLACLMDIQLLLAIKTEPMAIIGCLAVQILINQIHFLWRQNLVLSPDIYISMIMGYYN